MPKKDPAIILIETRQGCAILETTPRYDVVLRGVKWAQLHYNMQGYCGYLPTADGHRLSVDDAGISRIRKWVAQLNQEWATAGDAAIVPVKPS